MPKGDNKNIKEPIIYSEIKELETTDYRVIVASIKADELPQYAVQHKQYKVIEFANENLSFVKDWLNHFVNPPKQAEQASQLEFLPGELPTPKIKVS